MLQCSRVIMRRSIFCGILFSSGLLSAGFAPAHATDPTGDWLVEDGVANIRVAECNGSMWGAVSWEKKPGGIDRNNPDPAKKGRPTLGMVTLLDMKKNPKADEWNGKVYDAKDSGKLYSASIRPKGMNELEIEGCLVWPLCGSQTWTRVGPPIPSSPSNTAAKGAAAQTPAKPGIIARITGTAPKAAAPAAGAAPAGTPAPATAPTPAAAPKMAPAAPAGAPKAPGQKTAATTAAAGQAADIGDICLLPEIARPAR
jgi:uncharacterized protein (DUF2147 family)